MAQTYFRGDLDNGKPMIKFYKHPETQVDYLNLQFPGQTRNIWDQPVREIDKETYAYEWGAYLNNESQIEGQTKLSEIGWIAYASKENFATKGILTLEHLAAVTDNHLSALGNGSRSLRDRAKVELDKLHGSEARITALEEANKRMAAELAAKPTAKNVGKNAAA